MFTDAALRRQDARTVALTVTFYFLLFTFYESLSIL